MARPKTDLNLRATDLGRERKRSRKHRSKPDPHELEKGAEPGIRQRVRSMPLTPIVVVEEVEESLEAQPSHNDDELWRFQIADAFGTRSAALVGLFLEQLRKLCPTIWDADRQDWRVEEDAWNSLIALVADWSPENSAQACLAAQMAATHLIVMKLGEQSLRGGGSIYPHDAALSSKLARTFAMQCQAMQALKGKARKAEQNIHVTKETHQHVHYHDNRGGGGENANQCDATNPGAQTIEGSAALPSPDEIGKALPSASSEGLSGVSDARSKGGGSEG